MPLRSAFQKFIAPTAGATLASLVLFTAPSVYADTIRFGLHPGYGRIAFDWDMPVVYSASIVGDNLVVQFARPLTTDISPAVSRLKPYVTGVRLEDGGRTAYFTLRQNVTMKTFTLRNVVVVDLSTAAGFGEPRMTALPPPVQAPPPAPTQAPVAVAPPPVMPAQAGIAAGNSERVPITELAGPQQPPAEAPMSQWASPTFTATESDVTVRPRAEMGVTYYAGKFRGADVPALLGASVADDETSESATTSELTGDYRSVLALPRRAYAEGTLGVSVGTGPWYGDIYWRMALKKRSLPETSSMLLTRDTYMPDGGFGFPSATRTTTMYDYEAQDKFSRNQFGATIGASFWNGWSAFVSYRNAKFVSTSDYSKATVSNTDDYPDSTGLPLTGDPVPLTVTTTTSTDGRTSQTRFSLTTHTPTVGVGYGSALGQDGRHHVSAGLGASYSFAKLRFSQFDGETTVSLLDRDTGDPILTDVLDAQERPSDVTGLSPSALGFWANLGYRFQATPRLAFSLNGDAYRFRYGRSVLGNTGEPAGNFQELSLSGRLGLSYALSAH